MRRNRGVLIAMAVVSSLVAAMAMGPASPAAAWGYGVNRVKTAAFRARLG